MRRFTTAMLFSAVMAFSGAAKAGVHLNVQVVPPVYSGYYEMDDGYRFSEPIYVRRVEPGLTLRLGPMVSRLGETRVISGYNTRYYGYSPQLNRYYYYAPATDRYYYYDVRDEQYVSDRHYRRHHRDHDWDREKHHDHDDDDDD